MLPRRNLELRFFRINGIPKLTVLWQYQYQLFKSKALDRRRADKVENQEIMISFLSYFILILKLLFYKTRMPRNWLRKVLVNQKNLFQTKWSAVKIKKSKMIHKTVKRYGSVRKEMQYIFLLDVVYAYNQDSYVWIKEMLNKNLRNFLNE